RAAPGRCARRRPAALRGDELVVVALVDLDVLGEPDALELGHVGVPVVLDAALGDPGGPALHRDAEDPGVVERDRAEVLLRHRDLRAGSYVCCQAYDGTSLL